MTPNEILREIVAAEHAARDEYNAVLRQQEGLDSYLNDKTEELRKEYFGRADAEIAAAEKAAAEKADAQISALDATLEAEMNAQRQFFENGKAGLSARIFNLVVGNDGDA